MANTIMFCGPGSGSGRPKPPSRKVGHLMVHQGGLSGSAPPRENSLQELVDKHLESFKGFSGSVMRPDEVEKNLEPLFEGDFFGKVCIRKFLFYPDLPGTEKFILQEITVNTPEAAKLYEIESFNAMVESVWKYTSASIHQMEVGLLRQDGIEELRFNHSRFKVLSPKYPGKTGHVPPRLEFQDFNNFFIADDEASIAIALFPVTTMHDKRIGTLILLDRPGEQFSDEFIEKMWWFVYKLGARFKFA